MSPKHLAFDSDARGALSRGVDQVARAVRATLGPGGRTVLLGSPYAPPTIASAGDAIARDLELEHPIENLGAQLLKEVSAKTRQDAGDGSTTAMVLARAIVIGGLRQIAAGARPAAFRRGVERGVNAVCAALGHSARRVEDPSGIAQVASVAAGHDPAVGRLIAEAIDRVGRDGVVSVEAGRGLESTLSVTGGTRLDRGYLSPYFVTDAERLEVTLEPAHLLLCAQRITALAELVPVLERVAERGAPLLIVAEAIDGDALATLVVNALRGRLRIAAIRAPGFGETRTWALEDLAVLTGARVIDTRAGQRLEDAGLDALGRARRVVVDKETTTVIDGAGPEVGRTAQRRALETALAAAASDATRQRALRERLARFAAGVAVIRVGAPTAVALRAQRARFDDALAATRAALAEGVVTGGGVGLLRAAHALDDLEVTGDEATGIDTVRQALAEPLRRLAVNAGMPGAEVVERVRALPGSMGFNAATRRFEDLDRAGIVDPALVVRSALRNAASIAGLLLTTDAVVTEGGTASGGPDDPGEDDPDRRRGGSGA